MNPEVNYQHL